MPTIGSAAPLALGGAMLTGVWTVSQNVPLLRLAAGAKRPQLASAHHSEKSDDLTALQGGPVKGLGL